MELEFVTIFTFLFWQLEPKAFRTQIKVPNLNTPPMLLAAARAAASCIAVEM